MQKKYELSTVGFRVQGQFEMPEIRVVAAMRDI